MISERLNNINNRIRKKLIKKNINNQKHKKIIKYYKKTTAKKEENKPIIKIGTKKPTTKKTDHLRNIPEPPTKKNNKKKNWRIIEWNKRKN